MSEKPVHDAEIADLSKGLIGWKFEPGRGLSKEFKHKNFRDAMAFANRVAEIAEAANHHPDIEIHGWNRVRLRWMTHGAGSVTALDVEMARRSDTLVGG